MESAPLPSSSTSTSPPQAPVQVQAQVQAQAQAQDLPSYKEYQTARSKPIWRFLLISNLALGAYIFAQSGKKSTHGHHVDHHHHTHRGNERHKATREGSHSHEAVVDASLEEPEISSLVIQPLEIRRPLPAEEQRELFQWMLDEKRKVKPVNSVQKKRIDEEKALLKKFIRSETLPGL